jgi:hypothetical protein
MDIAVLSPSSFLFYQSYLFSFKFLQLLLFLSPSQFFVNPNKLFSFNLFCYSLFL